MNRTLLVSAGLAERKPGQDTDENSRRIEAELVGLLYKQAPSGFIATLVNAGIVIFMLWPSVSHSLLFIWVSLVVVVTAARFALVLHYRRTASLVPRTEYWRTRFIVGAGAAGTVWGAAGLGLFSPDSLGAQVFLVFMLGGMAAGGVVSLAPVRAAFFAFFLPTLLPITVRLLFGGEMSSIAMSLPLLAFAGVLLEMERRMHGAIVESLRLRFAHQTVSQKIHLSEARSAASEAAKQELEKEIDDRRQVEEQLRYRLRVEDALGRISRLLALSNAPSFQDIIRLLGEAVSVNRVHLFRLQDNGHKMENMYEWCDDKTAPQIETLQDVDPLLFLWTMRALKHGKNVIISDVNALPLEASIEKAHLQAQGVRSLLNVPILTQNGDLLGIIGFDDTEHCRTWSDEDLRMLRVVSEMLANYWTRIQAEEADQRNEARFRSLCASSPIGIFQNDTTGACLYINRRLQEIIGMTQEESLGNGWLKAVSPEDREAVFAEWKNCTRTGHPFSREFRFVRPNGEVRWVHARAVTLQSDRGEMLGDVGTIEDITERKRTEQALRESEERYRIVAAQQIQLNVKLQQAYDDLRLSQQTLLQQERLRALGQMASGVAHDINNAISPAVLYVESLLMSEPGLSTTAREDLTTVKQSLGDITRTVARLREFYRSSENNVEMVPVDLNVVVQTAIELTRARWRDLPQQRGATITLQPILEKELPAMSGVESELRQALINLIFNAVDAMPDGGSLTICTQVTATAVLLEVRDTGVGMDEETRRRCLEPFYTTKGERGTGLGLAMVYGILQRHAARINIVSAVGQGTTVQLIFPFRPSISEQAFSHDVETEIVPL